MHPFIPIAARLTPGSTTVSPKNSALTGNAAGTLLMRNVNVDEPSAGPPVVVSARAGEPQPVP